MTWCTVQVTWTVPLHTYYKIAKTKKEKSWMTKSDHPVALLGQCIPPKCHVVRMTMFFCFAKMRFSVCKLLA